MTTSSTIPLALNTLLKTSITPQSFLSYPNSSTTASSLSLHTAKPVQERLSQWKVCRTTWWEIFMNSLRKSIQDWEPPSVFLFMRYIKGGCWICWIISRGWPYWKIRTVRYRSKDLKRLMWVVRMSWIRSSHMRTLWELQKPPRQMIHLPGLMLCYRSGLEIVTRRLLENSWWSIWPDLKEPKISNLITERED